MSRQVSEWTSWLVGLLLVVGSGNAAASDMLPSPAGEPVDFAADVRPIFREYCAECHGAERQRSSFRLDRREAAFQGGDLGPAIMAGNSSESPLIRYVAGLEDGMRMPPDGTGLAPDQIGILRRWIDDGAQWPDALAGEDDQPAEPWWSFQPLVEPALPAADAEYQDWIRSPIDAFILAGLRELDLEPSGEADRRTLLRRLKFDLHGLGPTPEEIRAFLEDDQPLAYERLVDRLLASPHYGERWARHWLDVVHYADSHGQDQDRPRPHAWPYRDYLIRSFNSDRPYAEFIQQQVAGDVLDPDNPAAIVATGFLAAGPWDESSLRDIREDSIDRLIGQYLDRDDIVTSTMSSFTATTVGCARCHDHKFDPISQDDYYALQAVFAGVDKAERSYDPDPEVAARRRELHDELATLRAWREAGDARLAGAEIAGQLAELEADRADYGSRWSTLEPVSWKSQHGTILKALLDRSILAVGERPDKDTYTLTFAGDLPVITGLRLEVLTDETLPQLGPGRQDNGNFHLSEIRVKVHPQDDPERAEPVPIQSAAADFDQAGWELRHALDGNPATAWGIHPAVGVGHEAVFAFEQPLELTPNRVVTIELDQLHGGGHLLGRVRLGAAEVPLPWTLAMFPVKQPIRELLEIPRNERTDKQKAELAEWFLGQRIERELESLPAPAKVYCGTNQFEPDGSFRPANVPREVHVLARGEVTLPRQLAQPGALSAITGLDSRFPCDDAMPEGARRADLARWLSDPENPLTWRVMVNRLWHYHFGRGLVETPNDFGRMGAEPSHPELLDFLAHRFRRQGGSLKQLHRELVTSSTYRQSSRHREELAAVDSENRRLGRMNRRRLDAESVRDALLVVSGALDNAMFGPPVMHFNMSPGVHVTPNADYSGFDVDAPAANRRSVYRFIFRTRPDPWLEALDCPDASQSAPVRNVSLGPLQALALWNNPFVLRQAERLAERAEMETDVFAERVDWLAWRVFGRAPTDIELAQWESYGARHGLANLCRVLLNSSEFLFVD